MHRILVVDDDLSMREFLELMLTREGYDVHLAANGQQALAKMGDEGPFDLVITDIRMKQLSGLDVLRRVKTLNPETIVILISAFATAETAVIAMKEGAFDFFPKPFKIEELKSVIRRALAHRTLEAEKRQLEINVSEGCHFGKLVGLSPQMLKAYDLIRRAARTPTNILITGESGTGKELVARAIHENSPRASQPFVTINCGGMPEQLIESELFGHKKGAYTGATADKSGLFDLANQGTIFLDEVGELSIPMQVKLLRVVQEKTYRAVGGAEEHTVDVRLIAATNKDLEQEVVEGRFREDLYFRLNVIPIHVPPLRERQGDLPLLAHYFLEKYSRELNKNVWKISSYALDILSQYDFPGNVRELENIIQRSVALEQSNIILPDSLTLGSFKRQRSFGEPPTERSRAPQPPSAAREGVDRPSLEEVMARFETRLLLEALHAADGVQQKTAELLHTSARTIRYRMAKYGLEDLTPAQIEEKRQALESEHLPWPGEEPLLELPPEGLDMDAVLIRVEQDFIRRALEAQNGSYAEAAREVKPGGEQPSRLDLLIKEHGLSDRQAKALEHILERGSLTIQDFEHLCPEVNRRSLQRDLKAMIEKGIVVEKATSPTDPTKHYVLMEGTPG